MEGVLHVTGLIEQDVDAQRLVSRHLPQAVGERRHVCLSTLEADLAHVRERRQLGRLGIGEGLAEVDDLGFDPGVGREPGGGAEDAHYLEPHGDRRAASEVGQREERELHVAADPQAAALGEGELHRQLVHTVRVGQAAVEDLGAVDGQLVPAVEGGDGDDGRVALAEAAYASGAGHLGQAFDLVEVAEWADQAAVPRMPTTLNRMVIGVPRARSR